MRRVTATEVMAIVEATVVIAVIVCGDQKYGLRDVKKMTTATSPMAGANSRMLRSVS
jgi:hypothetical protein